MDKKLIFPFGSDAKFTLNPKIGDEVLTEADMLDLKLTIENKNNRISFTPLWKWTSAGIEVEIQRENIPFATTYKVNLDFDLPDASYSDGKKDIFHDCPMLVFVLDCDVQGDESVTVEISPLYKGDDGKSAFEIAVENGFVGTEEEWLESLKGKGLPTGGDAGQVLLKLTNSDYDYTWGNAGSGTGDMQSALYDPDGIKSDVFDMDNMKEGETNLLFKQSDKETISGKYVKPENGIPESDLSESVQESLSKADTALQEFTETDPTVPSWAKEASKPTYTANEVGALPESHNTSGTAHADIRQSVTTVSESLEGVETDISELRDNVSSIGQNVSVVEENISTLEQNISTLTQDVSTLGQTVSDIEQTIEGMEVSISVLENVVTVIDGKVNTLGQTVSTHSDEINDIKTTLGDVSAVLDIISGEVV